MRAGRVVEEMVWTQARVLNVGVLIILYLVNDSNAKINS